jgi:diguanylate cyclase (GGDEF)-like protein
MVEQIRTQLFMMLAQQAGPGLLPLSNLSPEEFLEFFRKAEDIVIGKGASPIVVYWSTRLVERLLPSDEKYRELVKESFCVSQFSENKSNKQDELCFLIASRDLSLVVWGHRIEDWVKPHTYRLVGSLDPEIVNQVSQLMLPVWQFVDPREANIYEDAYQNYGKFSTKPELLKELKEAWPVSKFKDDRNFDFLPEKENSNLQPVLQTKTKFTKTSPKVPRGASLQAAITQEAKRQTKSIKELRESWANLPTETRSIFPPDAQRIIRDMVGQLRHSSDLSSILQYAIEQLTQVSRADRGIIWQVVGDQLSATHEYAAVGDKCFEDTRLGPQESTAIVLEFLEGFPDESGIGVIVIPDTSQDTKLHKMSPTLASLIELGEVRARLVAQLRCRGIFSGFLELQQCKYIRDWSEQDASVLQSVAETLSFVVQQAFDLSRIEMDAKEMKLINEISSLFRESKGQRSQDTLTKSVKLVADHMGFINSQIYLFSEEEQLLISQITNGEESESISLDKKENPFVGVYESGKVKLVNVEYTRKGDSFFGHDTALIVPLISEGERLGVLALWQRPPKSAPFRAQDRELALTIAGNLASIIRADIAIAQVQVDRTRERLINRVSNEIRQSLKEVDQILETLVQALREHLDIVLSVVSLYDGLSNEFIMSKVAALEGEPRSAEVGEILIASVLDLLKQGQIIILSRDDIVEKLSGMDIGNIEQMHSATLFPLIQGESFKGALCMISPQGKKNFSVKDMNMIADLSDRVAVVISHKELFEQVEKQAITDAMTSLFNRRYFQEQLSKEIDRYQRFGHPFSLIIVDLDYLKQINDKLGHQYGDVAIKHIANVLRKTVRDVDTTARYGGEEFVALLPETEIEGARIVAERMCAAIREKPVEGVGVVTASIGVATFPVDAQDRDRLTDLADQALYLAKHRGRNQVCSVSEDLMPSLTARGEEALEVQKASIKAKAAELASIDLSLIVEHGLLGILGAVIKMIETRDAYSNDRSPRAAEYAGKLAEALNLSKEHITIISMAAILHNVGKIAVGEEILQKKGPLSDEERKIIQATPTISAKILEPAKHLHRVASVVESYHEHWDGTGYPKGLKGEDIPLESRIIALVDAYIAMTSNRPYRNALSSNQAASVLQEGAGTQWDPELVMLFLKLLQSDSIK